MHLEVFAAREDKDQLWHAMRSLQHAMRWDEERFGLEYDLDIYNIVAVRDFNMGAMENKSLTPGSERNSFFWVLFVLAALQIRTVMMHAD